MQGIAILNDPTGQPAILTVDLKNHDPRFNEALRSLMHEMERIRQEENEERQQWLNFSAARLNDAYGENEPEYSEADLVATNPGFRP